MHKMKLYEEWSRVDSPFATSWSLKSPAPPPAPEL